MSGAFMRIVGSLNEAIGTMKARAGAKSVRRDGEAQRELGRKQQADSAGTSEIDPR
jgi:hypothetical protein